MDGLDAARADVASRFITLRRRKFLYHWGGKLGFRASVLTTCFLSLSVPIAHESEVAISITLDTRHVGDGGVVDGSMTASRRIPGSATYLYRTFGLTRQANASVSPRTAKQPNCDVCRKPATPLSFGMCHNCYNEWARAGRPDLRLWLPRRRKWFRQHSTLKCAACDRLTSWTYIGMDVASIAPGSRPIGPIWTNGHWTGTQGPSPRGCLVVTDPPRSPIFGGPQHVRNREPPTCDEQLAEETFGPEPPSRTSSRGPRACPGRLRPASVFWDNGLI